MKEKSGHRDLWIALGLLSLFLGIFWISCSGGGGGGGGTSSGPDNAARLLRWTAPIQFADGGALDPAKDLSAYEVFINESGTFLPTDTPRAVTPAVEASSGNPTTSFDLAKVSPPLQVGKTYFLTMRTVEKNGGKSAIALPAVRFVY